MKHFTIVIGAMALAIIVALWVANTRIAQAPITATTTATTTPTPTPSTTSLTATLAIGQSTTIQGTAIMVRGPVEDSRCPTDVQCVWAGTVGVHISVGSSTNDLLFTLDNPQVVGDVTITLVSVLPTQKSSKQILQPSEYRFTFTVVPKVITIGGGGKVCTMEAKLCPDGSAVGRTGPNCEFAPCPTYNSGVRGTVLLGPTCPVMRDPPDPQCADKPYATAIEVFKAGSKTPFIIGNSDTNGVFEFSLPPGPYTLTATGGTMLPRCNETSVTVAPDAYVTATISCDTGIR